LSAYCLFGVGVSEMLAGNEQGLPKWGQ